MYQSVATADMTPMVAAHGTHSSRHRRDHQPTAMRNRVTAPICTITGIQPYMSDSCAR